MGYSYFDASLRCLINSTQIPFLWLELWDLLSQNGHPITAVECVKMRIHPPCSLFSWFKPHQLILANIVDLRSVKLVESRSVNQHSSLFCVVLLSLICDFTANAKSRSATRYRRTLFISDVTFYGESQSVHESVVLTIACYSLKTRQKL